MALEKLAEYPITRGGVSHRSLSGCYWADGVGLVGNWTPNGSSWFYGACQLDGELIYIDRKFSLISSSYVNYQPDLLTGRILAVVTYSDGWLYQTDPETNIFDPYIYGGDIDLPDPRGNMIRLRDRWFYSAWGNAYSAPLDGSQDWSVETTVPSYGAAPTISTVEGGLLWIAHEDGRLVSYDTNSQQVLSSNLRVWGFGDGIPDAEGIWWSNELNVFVALVNPPGGGAYEREIWTFANEVRPYSLSDPIALSTLQRGHVTTMEVTLLGEHNDPVADFPIDWSITSGTGSIALDQTLTDASGKAQVDYIPDDLASASFTLEAEARY